MAADIKVTIDEKQLRGENGRHAEPLHAPAETVVAGAADQYQQRLHRQQSAQDNREKRNPAGSDDQRTHPENRLAVVEKVENADEGDEGQHDERPPENSSVTQAAHRAGDDRKDEKQ